MARAGGLVTANLGIRGAGPLGARPAVRSASLLLCGADSALFRAGQTLVALGPATASPGSGCRVVGGAGYLPMLATLGWEPVERFRDQVELVDARGERDAGTLAGLGGRAGRPRPGAAPAGSARAGAAAAAGLPAAAAGRPAPPDRPLVGHVRRGRPSTGAGLWLTARVYGTDLAPRYEMAGARAESMLLGLLEAGVVHRPQPRRLPRCPRLAKAETALRLGLDYHQDLPLRVVYPTTVLALTVPRSSPSRLCSVGATS